MKPNPLLGQNPENLRPVCEMIRLSSQSFAAAWAGAGNYSSLVFQQVLPKSRRPLRVWLAKYSLGVCSLRAESHEIASTVYSTLSADGFGAEACQYSPLAIDTVISQATTSSEIIIISMSLPSSLCVAVLLALFVGLFYPPSRVSVEEQQQLIPVARQIVDTLSSDYPRHKMDKVSPEASFDDKAGLYNFGRFTRPIKNANLAPLSRWDMLTTDKTFVWSGMTKGNITVSLAMLQFNYAAAAVFAVYDATSGHSWSQYIDLPAVLALLGPKFEPDAAGHIGVAAGCARRQDWGGQGSVCYDETTHEVVVDAAATLKLDKVNSQLGSADSPAEKIHVSLSYRAGLGKGYFPTMVFPLGVSRAVTVSKYAARPISQGRLKLGDAETLDLTGALASTDYTRGQLRRETVWKWLSLSTLLPDGRPYGLHLSTGTYDFGRDNASSESSIFSLTPDGRPSFAFYDTAGVVIRPSDASKLRNEVPWRITGVDLDMTFTPQGGKFHGDIHLGVIDADLLHMWGTFTGIAPRRAPLGGGESEGNLEGTTVALVGVPGVLEDHYSLW